MVCHWPIVYHVLGWSCPWAVDNFPAEAWRIGRDSNPRAVSAATSLAKKRNRPDSATYPGLDHARQSITGWQIICPCAQDKMTIVRGHGAVVMVIYFPPQARTGRLSELVRNRSRKPASLCGLGVRIAHLPPIAHLREHVALSDCRSTVEHLTFNQGIAGSTPVSPTIPES